VDSLSLDSSGVGGPNKAWIMEVDGDDTNCFKYVVIGGGITGVSVVEKVQETVFLPHLTKPKF